MGKRNRQKKTRLSFKDSKEFSYVDGSVWSGQRRFKSFCVQPGFEISFLQSNDFFFPFVSGKFSVCRNPKNTGVNPYYLLFLTRDAMYLDLRLKDVCCSASQTSSWGDLPLGNQAALEGRDRGPEGREIPFLEGGWLSSGSRLVVVHNSGHDLSSLFSLLGPPHQGLFSCRAESFCQIVGHPAGRQVVSRQSKAFDANGNS